MGVISSDGGEVKSLSSAADVQALLLRRAAPPVAMPCLNPHCHELCTWTEGGRPALFCRSTCRVKWSKMRKKLMDDLSAIQRILDDPTTNSEASRLLTAYSAHLRWVLERYRLPS